MSMLRIPETARKFGLDGFLLALLSVIALAWLFPFPGSRQSPYHLKEIADYGVSLIFFFYGIRLGPDKLRNGLSNWKLHSVVHFSTFLLFPLIAFSVRPFFEGETQRMLWLGIFFLCILPSTVSSSVVMVGIARGNLPGAIFNASISSLFGVFITPLWMAYGRDAIHGVLTNPTDAMNGASAGIPLNDVILKLTLQVILPVALGMILHRRLGATAERYKNKIRVFDQLVILLIVYTSFCDSFEARLFGSLDVRDLFLLSAGLALLFFFVYGLITLLCRMLGFSREDEITAVFCGSKKSLVQGAVMSNVLFPGMATAGFILLPIMIYHSLQLVFAGILAQRYARAHPGS